MSQFLSNFFLKSAAQLKGATSHSLFFIIWTVEWVVSFKDLMLSPQSRLFSFKIAQGVLHQLCFVAQ